MKKLAILFLLGCSARIQAQTMTLHSAVKSLGSYGSPISMPSLGIVSGDLVIITAGAGNNSDYITGVTGSGVTTWNACPSPFPETSVSCYYGVATSTTSVAFVVSLSSSSHNQAIVAADFNSSVGGTWTFDAKGVNSGTAPVTFTTSASVGNSDELEVCIVAQNSGRTWTPSGSFALIDAGTSNYGQASWWENTSASSTQSCSMTNSEGSGTEYGGIVTFYTAPSTPTVAAPTFGYPNALNFTSSFSDSMTSGTSSASIIYTTDGSTPSITGSTGCTVNNGTSVSNGSSVTISATTTLKAIGCLSGDYPSSVTSQNYTLLSDTQVASDPFTSYYNLNYVAPGRQLVNYNNTPYQLPLDVWETGSAWENLGSGTYAVVMPDIFRGGSNYLVEGVSGIAVAERTNESYNQDHYSMAGIELTSISSSFPVGVTTRCSTSHCYYLSVYPSSSGTNVDFGDYFGSIIQSAAVSIATGIYTLELRANSCDFQPLLNGVSIPGFPTDITVSGCATTGQPGIYVPTTASGNTTNALYNWSGGNITGNSSPGGYTPPSPTYTTYSPGLNTSSFTMPTPPWYPYSFSTTWPGTFGKLANGSGYAAGITNGGSTLSSHKAGQTEYRAPFQINQWMAGNVTQNAFGSGFDNYFMPLLHQPIVPTTSCSSGCYDPIAIYLGLEPMNLDIATNGASATCAASAKPEYICTPFWHITTVDPTNSPGDQVNTLTGSTTTLMAGDKWEVRIVNNWVDAFCEQNSTALPTWSSGMTIIKGTTYIEAAGEIWLGSTTGTAGSTQPTWPTTTATWNSNTATGTTVSDGTGAWMYWGDACPTTAVYTRIMHSYYPYLSNPASTTGLTSPLGVGFPALWGQGTAVPLFTNVSMGSVGYGSGEPCQTPGNCVIPMIPQQVAVQQ